MKSNAALKALKEDKDFTRQELVSFSPDAFDGIDKAIRKLSFEDQGELAVMATDFVTGHENAVYSRYILGSIAYIRRPHEDNINMQNLLLTFYENHNWSVVEFLCGQILAMGENKYALRTLADCYEETGRAADKWPVWERLVKVDFEEKRILVILADHFREAGDMEKATAYYRRALTRSISSKDVDGIKGLWTTLSTLDDPDFGYLVGAAEKVASSVDRALAVRLLSELYAHYTQDINKSITLLKKALDIDPQAKEARTGLVKAYKTKYAKSGRLKACLDKSGLNNPGEDVHKAIELFETDIAFDVGSFVYQRSTDRIGIIRKIDDKQVVVAFSSTNAVTMTSDMAFKALVPLPKNNIRVLKTAALSKLQERVRKDTRWALVTLMESNGGKASFKEMKEELVPKVLTAKEWEGFRSDARRILQEDPYFSAVSGEADTYALRSTPITQEEKQLGIFNDSHDFYERVRICKDFVALSLDVESDAFAEMTSYFNAQLSRATKDNVDDRAVASYLLLTQLRDQYHVAAVSIEAKVDFAMLYKAVGDKAALFDRIQNNDLKRAFLENVMSVDRSWSDVYRRCFPYYTYAYIPSALKANGKEAVYFDMLHSSVENYRENVDVFLWFFKNSTMEDWKSAGVTEEELVLTLLLVLDHTASLIDLKKDVSENKKRNDQALGHLFKDKIIFRAIERGDQALASKIYSIVANDRYIDRGHVIEVRHVISEKFPGFSFFDDQPVTVDEDRIIPLGFLCTKKALDEKIQEKEHIEHVELKEVAAEIADARALGDLRENAEYQYGKDKQKNLNARLRTLSDEIEKAQVVTPDQVNDSKVSFGTTVVLHDRLQGSDVSYTVLGQWESDPEKGILNFKTPLGMKLLNHQVGDELDFEINGIRYSYLVKSISKASF